MIFQIYLLTKYIEIKLSIVIIIKCLLFSVICNNVFIIVLVILFGRDAKVKPLRVPSF